MSLASEPYSIISSKYSEPLTLGDGTVGAQTHIVVAASANEDELNSVSMTRSKSGEMHRTPPIVETIVESTKIALKCMNVTHPNPRTDPFTAELAVSFEGKSLPADSYISFPKSLNMIWNGGVVGTACVSEQEVNGLRLNPKTYPADPMMAATTRFIQSIFKDKSLVVQVETDEVDVFADGQEYKNVKINFCKSFSMQGFNHFKDSITTDSVKIIESNNGGQGGVEAVTSITIKNSTRTIVEIHDMPVEINYKWQKIGSFKISHFRVMDFQSTEQKLATQFRPERSETLECQEFISSYITTDRVLTVSYNMIGTVSSKENPTDTRVKVVAFEGEVRHKKKLVCTVDVRDPDPEKMTWEPGTTRLSPLIEGASVELRRHELLYLLMRRSLKVNVKVTKATLHIGEFELRDIKLEFRDPIPAK
ncbi:hypothetical protein EST38_g2232 [Candolleomyces aberdarensis]|uniref:Uncharacterized protein n=1 Tax=Candolleomyces aberdarensis TaxID=2316362 RepID=A0A4Q2DW41_9AGAR|nr:hypothetical protein EST38_g2232 [Candolleomyces aberdarensis]